MQTTISEHVLLFVAIWSRFIAGDSELYFLFCKPFCYLDVAGENAAIVLFVWSEAVVTITERWKCVWEESGGQCVMIHGTTRMLRWSADN